MELVNPYYKYISLYIDNNIVSSTNFLFELVNFIEKNNINYHVISDSFNRDYIVLYFIDFYLLKYKGIEKYYDKNYYQLKFNQLDERDFNKKRDIKKEVRLSSIRLLDWEEFKLYPIDIANNDKFSVFSFDQNTGEMYILTNNIKYEKISNTTLDNLTAILSNTTSLLDGINYGFFKENKELELDLFNYLTSELGKYKTHYL